MRVHGRSRRLRWRSRLSEAGPDTARFAFLHFALRADLHLTAPCNLSNLSWEAIWEDHCNVPVRSSLRSTMPSLSSKSNGSVLMAILSFHEQFSKDLYLPCVCNSHLFALVWKDGLKVPSLGSNPDTAINCHPGVLQAGDLSM